MRLPAAGTYLLEAHAVGYGPRSLIDGKPSRTFGEQGLDVPLDWVYGIEMYRSFYDIPLQYRDLMGDRRCGAILIWTHPVGWKPPPDSGRGR